VFWLPLPLAAVVAAMVAYAMPTHEPVAHGRVGRVHPGGTLALVAGAFCLQFVLERLPYDIFSSASGVWPLAVLGVAVAAWFVWHDGGRHDGLIPYRHFVDARFLVGLSVYFFGYVVSAAASYMAPVFLVSGLGFAVTSSGWLLGSTSLCGALMLPLYMKAMQHHPRLKHYLLLAMTVLFVFGQWMSGMSSEVTQAQLFWPLLLFNGLFILMSQATAATGTFRHVDEQVFSQAYQVKNAMRELAQATGVSVATVVLQMRSTLHYERLAEGTASISPWYASGDDPLHLHGAAGPSLEAMAQLASVMSRQATLMACSDFYAGLCVVAVVAAALVIWQRKFV